MRRGYWDENKVFYPYCNYRVWLKKNGSLNTGLQELMKEPDPWAKGQSWKKAKRRILRAEGQIWKKAKSRILKAEGPMSTCRHLEKSTLVFHSAVVDYLTSLSLTFIVKKTDVNGSSNFPESWFHKALNSVLSTQEMLSLVIITCHTD